MSMKMSRDEVFVDGEYAGIYYPGSETVNCMEKFDALKPELEKFARENYSAPVYREPEKSENEKWFEKEYGDDGLES